MPELPTTAVRSGLFTMQDVPVPVTGVAIDAEISSFCGRVSVSQRFVNREASPLEAVYVFPLEDGAAVCGFEAIIDGTLVVGEVKEREEAFRMYDEAMEGGHGAYLLDEERPDVFQASVGNLPPGSEVLLKLTYVTELTVEGNGLRFAIPTTVSPRYAPPEDHTGVGRPDARTLNPPVAWRVPYGLDLSIRLTMTGPIARVESTSHPVSVSIDGHKAAVTLSQRAAALDRDFVLSVEAEGLDAPQAWIERGDDGADAIAVGFVPKFSDASTPAEVIFLVDRSGSMQGTSIEEVRNALQLCLRSMIAGCRFNIIGFGSSYVALFEESQLYAEQSLSEASAHVSALTANLGGTELLAALEFALTQKHAGGLVRQVVILTDGQITNTDAVLNLAGQHAAGARIFTFGIGTGASPHLVRGLARAGGGTAEFIYPGERIEPKVVRQLGRLLSPSLTDVRMDWGGLDVTQAPSTVPPVFAGGRLLVFGLAKRGGAIVGPAVVRLTAASRSGPIAFEVGVDPSRVISGRSVAVLAARARIRELEESPEWTAARGSRQGRRKTTDATQEIIALGVKYGLMSRETSYVAIERREKPVAGDVQLRRVPIALTAGWSDLTADVILKVGAVPAAPVILDAPLFRARSLETRAEAFGFQDRTQEPPAQPRLSWGRSVFTERASRPAVPAPPPAMQALVALQAADGSWDLTRDLADIIGRSLKEMESAVAGATGNPRDARKAWATALALVWLRTQARHVEDQWSLLAAKARRWLDVTTAVPPGRGVWLDAAAGFLRP